MERSKWMQEIWSDIEDREIWRVALPATHGSGAFAAENTIGVRNQDLDIGGQLNCGARFFDIRVMYSGGHFVMHHNGTTVPSKQGLDHALGQIDRFLTDNDHEVIVIWLRSGWGSNLKPDQYPEVRELVLSRLAERLVPWDRKSGYTMRDIHATGRNVIILDALGKRDVTDNRFWAAGANFFVDTWKGTQSDCGPTPQFKVDWVEKHVEKSLRSGAARFFLCSCQIWTINLRDAAVVWTNPRIAKWLKRWAQDADLRPNMNAFGVDFVELNNNEVVDTIIAVNRVPMPLSMKVGNADVITADTAMSSTSPRYEHAGSFDLALARKLIGEAGLDWQKYKAEFLAGDELAAGSRDELAEAGFPGFVVDEFLAWARKEAIPAR